MMRATQSPQSSAEPKAVSLIDESARDRLRGYLKAALPRASHEGIEAAALDLERITLRQMSLSKPRDESQRTAFLKRLTNLERALHALSLALQALRLRWTDGSSDLETIDDYASMEDLRRPALESMPDVPSDFATLEANVERARGILEDVKALYVRPQRRPSIREGAPFHLAVRLVTHLQTRVPKESMRMIVGLMMEAAGLEPETRFPRFMTRVSEAVQARTRPHAELAARREQEKAQANRHAKQAVDEQLSRRTNPGLQKPSHPLSTAKGRTLPRRQ